MSDNQTGGKFERGSRITHTYIINDDEVREYLQNCKIPVEVKDVDLDRSLVHKIVPPEKNTIDYVITADGEQTTIPVKKNFPSSLITFFLFGSLLIKTSDLEDMKGKPFVSPLDIRKLKKIEREQFVLPTKNVAMKSDGDFQTAVRMAIQTFFKKTHSGKTSLLETLYWFLFELYKKEADVTYKELSHCPRCKTPKIKLERDRMDRATFSWNCTHPKCDEQILITDLFRLFEKIDNDSGATGIVNNLNNVVESMLLVHTIKSLLEIDHNLIGQFLFVKDGPLSFSGETANMHKPMQEMLTYLRKTNRVNLVGVESSGAFVEHAKEIKELLEPGEALLLNNEHIYSYIKSPPDHGDPNYSSSSYYSGKLIYKSLEGRLYVLTIPVEDHVMYYKRPQLDDLPNVQEILLNIDLLKCDIYENALIPVAVANKLISLTNHPSSNILERFAKKLVEDDKS